MIWLCRICLKKAKYIAEFGTSKIKNGTYKIHKIGYCEEHKPIIMVNPDEEEQNEI